MTIAWPADLVPVACEFFLQYNNTAFESPITRSRQVLRRQGERWMGTVSLRLQRAAAQRMDALLAQLKGSAETVYARDFTRPTPAGTNVDRGAIGVTQFTDGKKFTDGFKFSGGSAIVIVWRNQSIGANNVEMDGWYLNSTPLLAGDYIEINSRLYMLTADLTSNSIGRATASIVPPLRENITHGWTVVRTAAQTPMYLVDDNQPRRSYDSNAMIYDYTLSLAEAL